MHLILETATQDRLARRRAANQVVAVTPSRTALVVIDLQVGFMAEGAVAEIPRARDVVTNVNTIAGALRKAGGTVIFIQFVVDPTEQNRWTYWEECLDPLVRDGVRVAFRPGAPDTLLWPDLDVMGTDLVLPKTRLSALIPGTCDLHDRLQALGADTMIIAGTMTNGCCESTARDAMQMGYKVIFVEDANATWDDALQEATLINVAMHFGDVCKTEEVVARMRAG